MDARKPVKSKATIQAEWVVTYKRAMEMEHSWWPRGVFSILTPD